ncbi:MAG: PD-(D/E)XK nuclease family protein [Anaerolineae bacterium]
MRLPEDFAFSQASLQDFSECPRRFLLRYVRRLSWPAIEAEPALENELHMQQGARFHAMAHQLLLGVPEAQLNPMAQEEPLSRWWQAFITHRPFAIEGARYPEITLAAPIGDYWLVAKYDLLMATEQGIVILDWKTNRRRPRRSWLERRWQTRVYPYLAVLAAGEITGTPVDPGQVEMIYWFAAEPGRPERFLYDQVRFHEDARAVNAVVQDILTREEDDFQLTSEERHCRYCVYRSLCDRGVRAGAVDEQEAEAEPEPTLDFELDFEQIAEIEF